MEIDLGQEIVFDVKLGDKAFKLREPTALEVQAFQRRSQDSEDTVMELVSFVAMLGMEEQVAKSLGITKLNKLVEGIVGGLSEKK